MTLGGTWDEARLRRLGKRAAIVGLVVIGVVLAAFVSAAFVPRWWAHRMGDQAGGRIGTGVVIGLFYGAVFTVLPLLVLWFGFRKRRPYRVWALYVLGAVVLALPNLFTLGIVIGGGSGAHAGERTLDVEAPGFRGGTLAGVLIALAVFGYFAYQWITGHRLRRRVKTLTRQVDEGKKAAALPPPEPELNPAPGPEPAPAAELPPAPEPEAAVEPAREPPHSPG